MSIEFSSDFQPESLLSIIKKDPEVWEEAKARNVYEALLFIDDRATPEDEDSFSPQRYWDKLIKELYELFCTDSEKYKDEREKFKTLTDTTINPFVASIATAIAAVIAVEAAVLTPFIGLVLYAVFKLGRNTWCSVNGEDIGALRESLETVKVDEEDK